MSAIRLRDVRKGQVFYEADGPYTTKLRALEDASTVIGRYGYQDGWECNCCVVEGLCEVGEELNLYESDTPSQCQLRLYDRLHLDLPPPYRKRFGR